MTQPLWQPGTERVGNTELDRFRQRRNQQQGLALDGYAQLHQWSVDQPEVFWQAIWQDYDVLGTPGDTVLRNVDRVKEARFFPRARLNFAENLLRRRDEHPALVFRDEAGNRLSLSYAELWDQSARLAQHLKTLGVEPGDRVAAFMPNRMETVVTMLATASLGAIFSSCSPDFGFNGVLDRFGQIQPKVLVAATGYHYNGKPIDCRAKITDLANALPSLAGVVLVPSLPAAGFEPAPLPQLDKAVSWTEALASHAELEFAQLPFDHPLYILYSSGTTGKPKCIVHGAGGTLLQHIKEHRLHTDVGPDDVLFYFTTCGWMMWNWLVSGLATGATLVLFDGSPFFPGPGVLWELAEEERITVFGTSAKYLSALEKAGYQPAAEHDLPALKGLLSTGSPLAHEGFDFVYRHIKAELCLSSISGGTDIVSCFALGNPTGAVYRGQLQCLGLGMAVAVYDADGRPVMREKGELVCTAPFPSRPLGFWQDEDGSRYHNAYFGRFDNVWAHGDYAEVTAEGGLVIHGRSDAVLNPGGVRIGTAEIYRQVEKLDEVVESLAIGQQWQDDVRVVLFVVLKPGITLDDELAQAIRTGIRVNTTARHVPARIVQVHSLPRTLSGKLTELAVRQVVHGERVRNTDALANPEALEQFKDLEALKS